MLCCLTACVCVRQSVCAWTEWLPYSQTLFMVGMLLGSLFGGAISDRYHSLGKTREINLPLSCASSATCPVFVLFFCGRRYGKRPMLLVCLCLQAVCGPAPAALPHPLFFLAVRCLTGLCCCCINISSFSLGNHTHRDKGGGSF